MGKKKQTAGEKIAMSIDPEGTIGAALWRRRIARRIDAAIKRAVKEAHKGERALCHDTLCDMGHATVAAPMVRRMENTEELHKRRETLTKKARRM